MKLTVNNQPNTQQILPIPTNGIKPTPFSQQAEAARNGSLFLQNNFGPYNRPTIPLHTGRIPYGAPLPNNRFPTGVQRALPLFLGNDGSPQGSAQQLQPQPPQRASFNAWQVPIMPLYRPLRTTLV